MAEATQTGNPPQIEGAGFTPITTQEEFDKVAAGIRYAEKAKYSDYDTYKADAAELAKIRAANQTELQKAEERATKAEARVKDLESVQQVTAWKQEVEAATGVKASLLSGSTKEEIEKHAKDCLDSNPFFFRAANKKVAGRRPSHLLWRRRADSNRW
ncbi:MAG: hypothetical protein FWD43_04625 [Coriobacteriia bacterium]|nr:hypothetical protein [Coriobacteriia bacterium]